MKIEFSSSGVVLAKNQTLSLPAAEGVRIASERGTVWITQEGDRRDIVLNQGEAFVLERDTTAIIEAIDAAQITIAEPALAQPHRATPASWVARVREAAHRWTTAPAWA